MKKHNITFLLEDEEYEKRKDEEYDELILSFSENKKEILCPVGRRCCSYYADYDAPCGLGLYHEVCPEKKCVYLPKPKNVLEKEAREELRELGIIK